MTVVANPLIRKLANFVRLSGEDQHVIEGLSSDRVRQFAPRQDLIREGDRPDHVNLFLSGWACRYKVLENGRRQIIALLLPGDICDLNVFILREMDHSIATLTKVEVAEISRLTLEEITRQHPRITQALWWDALVSVAVQREWTVNLGQRNAVERIGHLLCELYIRLESIGLASEGTCDLHLTQTELADITGISAVHVNRSLQELRSANLVILRGKVLNIPNVEALKTASLFSVNYLHLDREGRHLDANQS